jgi:hypothetical protein
MKAIITGETGMVGKAVLLECIDDERITEVLLINRQACDVKHKKVKEIIHQDFFNLSGLEDKISGYDAFFFCMGVSSAGMNEEKYYKLTYTLTMGFANLMSKVNPNSTFCYISGAGTDSTEKKSGWAKVKGKTENAILALPFKAAYMFRPGYIQPMKGIKSKTPLYNTLYVIFKPLYFLIKPFKSLATDSVSLGKAMINVAIKGYTSKFIESKDIYLLSK